jgi:hypothetical protein
MANHGAPGITHHKGKGAQTLLPGRSALNQLSMPDAAGKTMNDYTKNSPTIAQNGPSLTDPEKQ